MNTRFNINLLTKAYSSNSQIARILTEDWVKENSYCPSCGFEQLNQFHNNSPVADFFCQNCLTEYELKSQKEKFSAKIVDGAYSTMIQRINSNNNPCFFFLNYSLKNSSVLDFVVIPKHYFIDDIIEKRNPLSSTARRAGWTGCNILLNKIPSKGKIFIIRNGEITTKEAVLEQWSKTAFLAAQTQEKRGWTIETLNILDHLPEVFNLDEVYRYEDVLKVSFPNNNFIKDKIRQQLQVLRDKGLIEFLGNGKYKKL